MALSKATKALLSLLSKPDIQVKKNYKFDRKVVNAANYHRIKHPYETMDIAISGENGKIPLRFFFPDAVDGRYPILLFFHGGGWVLGSIDRVTETIDNDSASGAVYVDGKTWTARSADGSVLPAGSRVEIRRMEGVKLIVEAAQKAPDKKEEVV